MAAAIKVINLDRRKDRYDEFVSKFNHINDINDCYFKDIPLFRVSAINGIDLIKDLKDKGLYDDPIIKSIHNLTREIPKAVLGCFLSHYFTIKEISKELNDDNDYVIILEDDVFFTDSDLKRSFDHIDNFIKTNDVDLVYLSGRFTEHFVPRNTSFFEKKSSNLFLRLKGKGYDWDRTAVSYLITKKGSEKIYKYILNYVDSNNFEAIDNILINCRGNIYDFFPHLFYCKPDYNTDIQKHNLKNTIHTNFL